MKIYRCKICGATKSKKGVLFMAPERKARALVHGAAAHAEKFSPSDLEIIDL